MGGDNDHHNFCCSSDFSSSAATTVNMLTIFEWELAGEGGGKKDGYCINKDGDGVQYILSSMATTMTVSVLMPKRVANNGDLGPSLGDGRMNIA